MKHVEILSGDASLLDRIEPLWMKLNELHASTSTYFAESFKKFTYRVRTASLVEDTEKGALLVEIALDSHSQVDIGYCIAAINSAHKGEIESIYIDPKYRGLGIGDNLMKRALKWLDERKVSEKTVSVVYGNENVFTFYAKFGF